MKKLVMLTAAIASCSLLSACGTDMLAPKLPDFDKKLSFSAEVSVDEALYCADFERKGAGDWLIYFSSPFSMGGMSFEIKGTKAVAVYDGVETAVDMADFRKSPLCALIDSVDEVAVCPSDMKVIQTQNGLNADGKAGELDFTLKLDDKGAPVAVEISSLELFAAISSFEITGEAERPDVVGVY